MQEKQVFDPFDYFGALHIPVIPPEDEPGHELITKVFNNPLVKQRRKSTNRATGS